MEDDIIIGEIFRRYKETGWPIREIIQSGYMMQFRSEIDRLRHQAMLDEHMRGLIRD